MYSKTSFSCVLFACALSACEARPRAPQTQIARAATIQRTEPAASLPLAQRLELEATSNPEGVRRVHDLLEGLTRESLFVRTRQVLALPVGADYCSTAITSTGVGVSLCAFQDDASAQAGRARSRQLFDRLIPDRTLLVRDSTLLTLSPGHEEAARREAERLAALFPSLTDPSADTQTALNP